MSDPYTVHHLDNSRSHRILWLLEELGAPYEIREHRRDPKTMRAPRALRDIHPLGKAPIVVTPDGVVLAESGAIVDELVDRHDGQLRPEPGTDAHRRYRYFLHYAEGSLMPPLLVKLVTGQIRDAPVPFFLKPVTGGIAGEVDKAFTDPEIALQLDFMEQELTGREWFAGDEFTAADVQMSFPVEAAESRGGFDAHPRLADFVARLRARPAYRRAVERGGALELGSM